MVEAQVLGGNALAAPVPNKFSAFLRHFLL
jgi:hypothetical protein